MMITKIEADSSILYLKDAWDAINSQGPDNPTLSYDWIISLLETHLDKKDVFILILEDAGRVVAIAPFFKTRIKYSGMNLLKLSLLSNLYCCHNDLLLIGNQEKYIQELINYLVKEVNWDVLEFEDFLENSKSVALLSITAKKMRLPITTKPGVRSPYIEITGDSYNLISRRSPKTIGDLKRKENKLANTGKLSVITYTPNGNIMKLIDKIYYIEKNSWKESAKTSITTSPKQMKFYELYLTSLIAQEKILIEVMEINNEPIAYSIMLRHRNKIYLLKNSYIEKYKRYSPGTLLFIKVMENAFEQGIEEYDFTGKAENAKMEWTDKTRQHVDILLYNRKINLYMLFMLKVSAKKILKLTSRITHLIFSNRPSNKI